MFWKSIYLHIAIKTKKKKKTNERKKKKIDIISLRITEHFMCINLYTILVSDHENERLHAADLNLNRLCTKALGHCVLYFYYTHTQQLKYTVTSRKAASFRTYTQNQQKRKKQKLVKHIKKNETNTQFFADELVILIRK